MQVHLGSKSCWNRTNAKGEPHGLEGYGCNNSLAAVMVVMREGVYIGAGNWRGTDILNRLIPEFHYPLGAPIGLATLDTQSGTYSRSFASGTSVTYNPMTGLGEVKWAHKQLPQRLPQARRAQDLVLGGGGGGVVKQPGDGRKDGHG
eukprot:SAG22_NODE_3949_length_1454_cov_1.016236_3_plen_147_part_00